MALVSGPLGGRRLASRFMVLGIAVLAAGIALAAYATIAPVEVADGLAKVERPRPFRPLLASRHDVRALLATMAGYPLIRPPQVIAAVKDTGLARRLLKKLKLHGVAQIGSDYVAYVQVDAKEVKRVSRGDAILDFRVEKVELGKVTLLLDAVVVTLTH